MPKKIRKKKAAPTTVNLNPETTYETFTRAYPSVSLERRVAAAIRMLPAAEAHMLGSIQLNEDLVNWLLDYTDRMRQRELDREKMERTITTLRDALGLLRELMV